MRFKMFTQALNLQSFYDWCLHKLLRRMGYGIGGNLFSSGELPTLEYIREHFECNRGLGAFVLFDIGANIGDYTTYAAHLFHAQAEIHAFEPEEKSFKTLQKRMAEYKESVSCYPLALGQSQGLQSLFSQASDTSTAASFFKYSIEKWAIPDIIEYQVEVTTLDSFCEQYDIRHIDLLKLDVEGYEFHILTGAQEMIERGAIDWIQFEFSDLNIEAGVHFKTFWDFLNRHYQIYRILRTGLYPITAYKPRYEIYQTANFLAKRRG